MSFAKSICKNIGNNIKKNLNGKYSQKLFDHANQSATDALKITSKRIIQKTAGATGDLIGTKIADALANLTAVKLRKSQKLYRKIIQRQLKMNMIEKYLKKDIYLQKKDG